MVDGAADGVLIVPARVVGARLALERLQRAQRRGEDDQHDDHRHQQLDQGEAVLGAQPAHVAATSADSAIVAGNGAVVAGEWTAVTE